MTTPTTETPTDRAMALLRSVTRDTRLSAVARVVATNTAARIVLERAMPTPPQVAAAVGMRVRVVEDALDELDAHGVLAELAAIAEDAR